MPTDMQEFSELMKSLRSMRAEFETFTQSIQKVNKTFDDVDAPVVPYRHHGGGFARFLQDISFNPNAANMFGSAMANLPLSPTMQGGLGLAGLTSYAYGVTTNAQLAMLTPQMQMQTQTLAQQMSGQIVPLGMQAGNAQAAAIAGGLQSLNTTMQPFTQIPFLGGGISAQMQMGWDNPGINPFKENFNPLAWVMGGGKFQGTMELERKMALAQATGVANTKLAQMKNFASKDDALELQTLFNPDAGHAETLSMIDSAGEVGAAYRGYGSQRYAQTIKNFGRVGASKVGANPYLTTSYATSGKMGANPEFYGIGEMISGDASDNDIANATIDAMAARGDAAGVASFDGRVTKQRLESAMATARANKSRMGQNLAAGFGLHSSSTRTQITAMTGGSEADVLAGFSEQRGLIGGNIDRTLAQLNTTSDPVQRERLLAQIKSGQLQGVELQRAAGGYSFGLASGRIGLAGEQAASGMTSAMLFGGAEDVYGAAQGQVGVARRQVGLLSQRGQGAFGPLSEQEQLGNAQALAAAMRGLIEATTSSERAFRAMQTAVSSTGQAISGVQASRAFQSGAGGIAGMSYTQNYLGKALKTSGGAKTEMDTIRQQILDSGGDPEANQAYQDSVLRYEGSLSDVESARIGVANTPMPLSMRRGQAHLRFQNELMQSLPGTYGSLRQNLGDQIRAYGAEVDEISGMRERMSASGQLDEAASARLDERSEDAQLRRAGAFRQLAEGANARFAGMMVGTPGSFNLSGTFASMKAAVGAMDVPSLPYMGFTKSGMKSWDGLTEGMSLAGSQGTMEGVAASALTGNSGGVQGQLQTQTDILREMLATMKSNGVMRGVTGTGRNFVDTSQAGIGEQSRMLLDRGQ